MKKIDDREHQQLLDVFERYINLYDRYGNLSVPEDEDETIRTQIAEFQGSYDYYKVLLFELKKCLSNYNQVRHSLKNTLYAPVRKMRTIDKNRN